MIIKCEERYQEAKAFAEKTGDNTLQNRLERLTKCEENNDSTIYLCKDFAPLSFYFEEYAKNGKRIMKGGILYHGNPDESRAVTFDPAKGWQTHT